MLFHGGPGNLEGYKLNSGSTDPALLRRRRSWARAASARRRRRRGRRTRRARRAARPRGPAGGTPPRGSTARRRNSPERHILH